MPTCETLIPGQLLREAVEIAEDIHESFLKTAEAGLSDLLQAPVALAFEGAAQVSMAEITTAVAPKKKNAKAGDTNLIALSLAPMEGAGFLSFPRPLLFRVLDILLATPDMTAGGALGEGAREVTGIELFILREFFEVFAHSLRKAWEPVCSAGFTQLTEDALADLPEGEGMGLALAANVEVGGVSESFRVILPAFLSRLAHMKAKEAAARQKAPEPHAGLLNSLAAAEVRLDAVLEGRQIRMRDLMDLAPGQILMAGDSSETPFACLMNGVRGFTGDLVASGGRCAIRIENLPGETSEK